MWFYWLDLSSVDVRAAPLPPDRQITRKKLEHEHEARSECFAKPPQCGSSHTRINGAHGLTYHFLL